MKIAPHDRCSSRQQQALTMVVAVKLDLFRVKISHSSAHCINLVLRTDQRKARGEWKICVARSGCDFRLGSSDGPNPRNHDLSFLHSCTEVLHFILRSAREVESCRCSTNMILLRKYLKYIPFLFSRYPRPRKLFFQGWTCIYLLCLAPASCASLLRVGIGAWLQSSVAQVASGVHVRCLALTAFNTGRGPGRVLAQVVVAGIVPFL